MNISLMLIRVQKHCHVVLKVYALEANNLNFKTDEHTNTLRLKQQKIISFLKFSYLNYFGLVKNLDRN